MIAYLQICHLKLQSLCYRDCNRVFPLLYVSLLRTITVEKQLFTSGCVRQHISSRQCFSDCDDHLTEWPFLSVWHTEDPQDIYWLAQCLYLTSQYHRASHALRSRKLDKVTNFSLQYVWIIVMCKAMSNDVWVYDTNDYVHDLVFLICVMINSKFKPMATKSVASSSLCLKQHLSFFTQLYGACQYLAARCHVSDLNIALLYDFCSWIEFLHVSKRHNAI